VARAMDSGCRAFQEAIAILGRPWTGLILNLLRSGSLRFSELQARVQGLGAKTLSARLKILEKQGIVVRQIEGGPPIRVLYSLTRKGKAFEQVAKAIELWGRDLILIGEEPRARISSGAVLKRRPASRASG
jgi:DNA-binding HxlR family transcriptional regulator